MFFRVYPNRYGYTRMSSDHYSNYVEKLRLIFTAEPTENLVSTLYPTPYPAPYPTPYPAPYPTPYPTAFIIRNIEPLTNNNLDIISMIVVISVATSTFTTICIVCTGICCYYLRNRLRLDEVTDAHSSQEFGVFELDDICNDGQTGPLDNDNDSQASDSEYDDSDQV